MPGNPSWQAAQQRRVQRLRPLAHTALKSDGLTVHVLEVGSTELDHDTANLGLDIAIVTRRRRMDVSLEGLGIRGLEILELIEGKRAGRRC